MRHVADGFRVPQTLLSAGLVSWHGFLQDQVFVPSDLQLGGCGSAWLLLWVLGTRQAGSVVRITITPNLILHWAAFLSGDTPDL